jgi:hypothetical protein
MSRFARAALALIMAGLGLAGCRALASPDECEADPEIAAAGCTTPRSAEECDKGILVSVSREPLPRIDWTPQCAITHLVVISVGRAGQEGVLVWSFSAPDGAAVRPGVRYGVLPAGAILEGPTRPLQSGTPYRVTVERILGGTVIAAQGATTFIP